MPFKVKYSITHKILNNISSITAGREIIERSKIIPKWELRLKKEARIQSAHSSTSIEGNRLTLEEVRALSENEKVVATEKDKREVLNYLQALDAIPGYAAKRSITVKLLLDVQKKIAGGTLDNPKDCGTLRDRQVFVGKRVFDGTGFKEIVEYMPPDTKDVPGLMEEFLEWLNSEGAKNINPIILAGIAHYEIARIHPFIDGNGRTARLLAALVLYKSGFDHRRFFALDDYYDRDRHSYYAALKTAQQGKGDITKWLEYFTNGVLYSVNKVKETVVKFSFIQKPEEIEQIELTERQIRVMDKIEQKGKVTNKELRSMFRLTRQAILKEIKKLVKIKVIKLAGKGRGAYYRMASK